MIQSASTMDFFHSFTVHRKYILKETVFYNTKKKSCNSYIGFLSQLWFLPCWIEMSSLMWSLQNAAQVMVKHLVLYWNLWQIVLPQTSAHYSTKEPRFWYGLLCRIVETHEKKLLFHISFPVFETDDGEANISWSCCTFCCRRFEWLHPHLVIWWEHSEALTVCLDSMTFHSLERSSPALLRCLIESPFIRDYSCDYITKRCRQIDKDENPLYYLALILFYCGLFCFTFPSQIGVKCRNLRERTRTQTVERKTVNCSWKPYKSRVLRRCIAFSIYI